jgi:hypothetical protein
MLKKMISIPLAVAVCGACQPAFAAEATSEAFPQSQNLVYYHAPGPDLANESAAAQGAGGSQYLFLAGSAFNPRTSSQLVTYPGNGCTYSDGAVTTSLELPDGAEIQGVRLYYYNNASAGNVSLFATTYTGAGGSSDLITGSSTETTGYVSEFFVPSVPFVIDNVGQAYVLTATMNVNLRFCGMRVFYAP